MKLLFLRDCVLNVYYDWHCGDGCCSGEEYDYIDMKAGEVLTLDPSRYYRRGDYELTGKYHDDEHEEDGSPLYVYIYTIDDWVACEFCKILND